jgi:hypothetical protein
MFRSSRNPRPYGSTFRALTIISLIILCGRYGFAQTSTATLGGLVQDANGAVIPGATITVTNVSTTLKRSASTNKDGNFAIPLLPPGTYTLRAEHEGFKIVQVEGVVLNIGDQKALQIQLNAGDLNETVQITGDTALIEESASVGTVVDRQFVENIPLNGRSFQSLITLTPGIVTVPAANAGAGQFSVNGQRANANAFYVDGVSANIGTAPNLQPGAQTSGNLPGLTSFGTTQSLVSIDALEEFKVQTSTYSAEYGRQPGGQISLVTRSGTNSFHGSAFDFIRNDIFDANNWFSNRAGQKKPPMRQNNFGGTFSGPVLLPRFGEGGKQPGYNGRNRTFFFFSYEGLRLLLPQFALTNVPSLTLRQNAPASERPALNAFPLPNGPTLANGLAEFSASYSNPSNLDATSIRVDHSFNSKWSVFGRYNRAPSATRTRSQNNLATIQTISVKTQTTTLGLTAVLTPRLTNELKVNSSQNGGELRLTQEAFSGAVPATLTSIIPPQYLTPTSQGNFVLNFTGRTGVGTPQVNLIQHSVFDQNQFNIVNNTSYTKGDHQFKFGVDYRRIMPVYAVNEYVLQSLFTTQQQVLNGLAATGNVVVQVGSKPIYQNFSTYVQDAWKVSQRLTLNLGVRWDVNPAPTEADNKRPVAVVGTDNLATMQLAPLDAPLWHTTFKNFAPRFGAAYRLRDKLGWETVLRGGFGVFYDAGNNQGSAGFSAYPFIIIKSVTNVVWPLSPTQLAPPALPTLASPTFPLTTVNVFDPDLELPYTLQWNVAVAQSIGQNQALTVSYVGSAARRLLQRTQFTLTGQNPRFTTVTLTRNAASSDYNALQAQFQRRLSRGLQALVSYSWSHALDEDSVDNGTIRPVRGNASFDVRHLFASAITYDIPAPSSDRFVKATLGDWSFDTTIHAQSAPPLDIIGANVVNPADGTLVGNRPNVVLGVPLYVNDPSVPGGRSVNRAAFSLPLAGQFGNLGRNVVRGFGAWQFDTALRREFHVRESLRLQFRAEAFNLFNHPNFGAIQTTLTAANFGQATNTLNQQLSGISQLYQIGGPRSLQFAVKVLF